MLQVTYRHFCDVCGEPSQPITSNIPTGGHIPMPPTAVVMNNAALCTICAELAVPAMNEALQNRLLQPKE